MWIVQLVVAIGLVLAAVAYAMTNLQLFPGGGTAAGLAADLTVIAIAANFVFGILLNFGVRQLCADARDAEPHGHGSSALLSGDGRRRPG